MLQTPEGFNLYNTDRYQFALPLAMPCFHLSNTGDNSFFRCWNAVHRDLPLVPVFDFVIFNNAKT